MTNAAPTNGDSAMIVTEPLQGVLDPQGFTPRLIALLSNALVWRESQELRRQFGLGTNEWRVISAIAAQPGSSASVVAEALALNKAVVSKSASALRDRGLIVLDEGPHGSRPLFLTHAGAHMHDLMKPISVLGEEVILDGLTKAEVQRLNEMLLRMIERVRELQRSEADAARKAGILPRPRMSA